MVGLIHCLVTRVSQAQGFVENGRYNLACCISVIVAGAMFVVFSA